MNKFCLMALVLMLAHAARAGGGAEGIEILSPHDYQVFQRQSASSGRVLIRGRVNSRDGAVQMRWSGTPAAGQLPDGWQVIVRDAAGSFAEELSVPAGGWYGLELRVIDKDRQVAMARIDHVGVGEVFVIAGQSNSTNYGSEKQKPQSGLVSSFDGSSWQLADDPQPGTQDRSHGGSFLPAFGDAIEQRYHVPIGLASCGCGATSVRQWLMKGEKIEIRPTTDRCVKTIGPNQWECTGQLYDGLLKRMTALGPHGFRAVLWHQGESDAGQAADHQITGERYKRLLEKIIQTSRKDAGWDIPWFVAEATYHSAADPANAEFRAAQEGVVDDSIALQGPDTDALGAEYRAGVHFNSKGLHAHGELWAKKVGTYLDQALAARSRDTRGAPN
jgi:hypothetical protein